MCIGSPSCYRASTGAFAVTSCPRTNACLRSASRRPGLASAQRLLLARSDDVGRTGRRTVQELLQVAGDARVVKDDVLTAIRLAGPHVIPVEQPVLRGSA